MLDRFCKEAVTCVKKNNFLSNAPILTLFGIISEKLSNINIQISPITKYVLQL